MVVNSNCKMCGPGEKWWWGGLYGLKIYRWMPLDGGL